MRAFSTEKLPLGVLRLPIEGGRAESRGRMARFIAGFILGTFLSFAVRLGRRVFSGPARFPAGPSLRTVRRFALIPPLTPDPKRLSATDAGRRPHKLRLARRNNPDCHRNAELDVSALPDNGHLQPRMLSAQSAIIAEPKSAVMAAR